MITDNKQKILDAAIELASECGINNITRRDVAKKAQVSTGLVSYHFGEMCDLMNTIMHVAVEKGHSRLIVQGVGIHHPTVMKAPADIRKKAFDDIYKSEQS